MTVLIAFALAFAAGIALGYLLGDIGGEQRAYRQFMAANRSPRRRSQ